MTTLQIQLSDDLTREVERLAREAGQNREEFIVDALRRRVDLARGVYRAGMSTEGFEAVRERLRPYAEQAGYTDEQEILDDISA